MPILNSALTRSAPRSAMRLASSCTVIASGTTTSRTCLACGSRGPEWRRSLSRARLSAARLRARAPSSPPSALVTVSLPAATLVALAIALLRTLWLGRTRRGAVGAEIGPRGAPAAAPPAFAGALAVAAGAAAAAGSGLAGAGRGISGRCTGVNRRGAGRVESSCKETGLGGAGGATGAGAGVTGAAAGAAAGAGATSATGSGFASTTGGLAASASARAFSSRRRCSASAASARSRSSRRRASSLACIRWSSASRSRRAWRSCAVSPAGAAGRGAGAGGAGGAATGAGGGAASSCGAPVCGPSMRRRFTSTTTVFERPWLKLCFTWPVSTVRFSPSGWRIPSFGFSFSVSLKCLIPAFLRRSFGSPQGPMRLASGFARLWGRVGSDKMEQTIECFAHPRRRSGVGQACMYHIFAAKR